MPADLTVSDVARDARLHLRIAVGGPALDRHVRWAHSTELLDPRPYLRGGELVLTVGSGLTDPERCIAFVHALTQSRACALGLGLGDVHAEPPESLVAACREEGLPLLLVPPTTPFMEITELLADHRVRMASDRSRRAITGRLLEAVYRHQASPDVVHDDIESVGLQADHLVASVWGQDLSEGIERQLGRTPHLIGELPGLVVLLTSNSDAVDSCAAHLDVTCCVSDAFELDGLPAAMAVAIESWHQAARQAGPDAGVEPAGTAHRRADRSHYTHLIDELPEASLASLLAALIEPLEAYDSTAGASLVSSLEVFLRHDGSVQAAARTMHLHPNSLRHRLSRVYELTGRNPLLFRDQVDFALALQARRRWPASGSP